MTPSGPGLRPEARPKDSAERKNSFIGRGIATSDVRNGRARGWTSFDDLPVRILADHLAVSKLVVIAPSNGDLLPRAQGSGQKPLRNPHAVRRPVTLVAIVDVRKHFKAAPKTIADFFLANVAGPPRRLSSGHIQRAVVGEETHHPVQVVRIEGIGEALQDVQVVGGSRHGPMAPNDRGDAAQRRCAPRRPRAQAALPANVTRRIQPFARRLSRAASSSPSNDTAARLKSAGSRPSNELTF